MSIAVLTPEQRKQFEAADLLWWHETTYGGKDLPIHPEQPKPGYYRCRDGVNARWAPAAIWRDDGGQLQAIKGFRDSVVNLTPGEIKRVWPYWARERVTWEAYDDAMKKGEWASVTAGLPGSNLPNGTEGESEYEALKEAIAASVSEALKWIKQFEKGGKDELPDQEAADKTALLAEKVWALHNRAEAARKKEKAPLLAKVEACDAKWFDDCGIKLAKRTRDRLVAAVKSWGERELRRREAAALAKLKESQSISAIPQAEPVTFATTANKAGVKRLTTKPTLVITSYDELRAFFKDTDEYKAAMEAAEKQILERLASEVWRKNVHVPGTKVENVAA